MSKWVDIRDLLRFEASADGTSASLIAVERHGELIALNFTVTCLSRLMLTLPKMIDAVVQQRGNHPGPARCLPARYVEGGACRRPNTHPHAQDARWVRNLLHGQRGEIRPNPRDLRGWRGDRVLPVRNVPSARDISDERSERAAAGWRSRTARRRAVVEADCCTCTGLFLARRWP